jgi:hypothetical protein
MSRRQFEWNTTTEVLEYYPENGVATASTIAIYTSGTSALLVPTAVVLDAANQALGAHLAGVQTLTVASSALFYPGKRYWLDDGYLGYEVEVYAVPLATSIVLTEPIKRAITAGSIKGHGLRKTITAAISANLARRLRVVWRPTIAAVEYRYEELIDIVRWPFDLKVTEDDLEAADPSFGEQTGTAGKWRLWVKAAIEDIWLALEGAGVEPDKVRSRDLLLRPVIYRALYHRHNRDSEQSAHYLKCYEDAWRSVLSCRDSWYDSDDDLVPEESESTTGEGPWVEVGAGSNVWVRSGLPNKYSVGAVHRSETAGLPAAKILKIMG